MFERKTIADFALQASIIHLEFADTSAKYYGRPLVNAIACG
jgi:hypothetical protein